MWKEAPLESMPRNRVEQLESTVVELESTIEGLTDELVEAKERIRVLEAELDTEVPTRVPERRVVERREAAPDDVEAATAQADASEEPEGAEEASESRTNDIIIA